MNQPGWPLRFVFTNTRPLATNSTGMFKAEPPDENRYEGGSCGGACPNAEVTARSAIAARNTKLIENRIAQPREVRDRLDLPFRDLPFLSQPPRLRATAVHASRNSS